MVKEIQRGVMYDSPRSYSTLPTVASCRTVWGNLHHAMVSTWPYYAGSIGMSTIIPRKVRSDQRGSIAWLV